MYEVSKSDWKLFREKIGGWQERYMERLVEKYIKFLSSDKAASEKFWELEKKIKKDQKNPGVILELRKSDVPWDLAALIKKKVIKIDDISEFSEDLQDAVKLIIYGRED